MDRDILFRGKHVHVLPGNKHLDGTWVYGYYLGNGYILTEDGEMLVDNSTVGQYIGIKDKNHNKIYIDDIVTINDDDEYFLVEYDIDSARYLLRNKKHFASFENLWGHECKIVGNIYDNPRLLEEGVF